MGIEPGTPALQADSLPTEPGGKPAEMWMDISIKGFPSDSVGKESACNAGDLSSIPGLGRSPEERNSYLLQYSELKNSTDCIVHGVARVGHD